jgi:hypothetical protein
MTTVNAMNAISQGLQTRSQFDTMQRKNALQGLMQQQGPALMNGDPNALNALAQMDPQAAMQMRQGATAWKEEAAKRLVQMVSGAQDKPAAYAKARQYAGQIGLDVSQFPEQWGPEVEQSMEVMSRLYAMPPAERTEFERLVAGLPEEQRGQAVLTRLGLAPRATAPSEVEQYGFKVPAGYRMAPGGTGVEPIPGYVPKGGQMVEMTGPDGTTIRVGPSGGNSDLGRPAQNEAEKSLLTAKDALARYDRIDEVYKEFPEALEAQTLTGELDRLSMSWEAYIDPKNMDPARQERYGRIVEARQAVLDNLNRTIKDITGAAMTNAEAERIKATVPNVQDDPIAFQRKLDAARRMTRQAVARYHWWMKNGTATRRPQDGLTLFDVQQKMDKFETRQRADLKAKREALLKGVQGGVMGKTQAEQEWAKILDAQRAAFLEEFGV